MDPMGVEAGRRQSRIMKKRLILLSLFAAVSQAMGGTAVSSFLKKDQDLV